MFCPNCGKELPDGAKFCDECGTRLSDMQPDQYEPPYQDAIQEIEEQNPYAAKPPARKISIVKIIAVCAVIALLIGVARASIGMLLKTREDTGSQSGGSFGNCTAIVGEFFNDRFFTEMNALLDEAAALAKGDREITARIEFLRKGLRDTELTRKTRIAQKAHAADRKNAAKKAAFDAAFKAMNDYRASIEDEPVCNFNTAAFREWAGMRWPHVKVVK
jgi:hypothetical protein